MCAEEFQESLKSNLQHKLQEVEQRRHDLMPEHQIVQKRSQKKQSIQEKRRNMQKENVAAEEKMRNLQEDVKQTNNERIFFSFGQSRRTRWLLPAELLGLQA